MTNDEYIANEKRIFLAAMARAERGSPKEKREAFEGWRNALQDPELIAERIGWLLAGHYGKGAYDAAWEAVDSRFIKPTTSLLAIIAALEWMVPRTMALKAEQQITPSQLAAVFGAVENMVTSAMKEAES